jgi:hypothetical protein
MPSGLSIIKNGHKKRGTSNNPAIHQNPDRPLGTAKIDTAQSLRRITDSKKQLTNNIIVKQSKNTPYK